MKRSREEERETGRDVDLAHGEFAFEEESRDSRWPLLLVVALLLLIVGFVSWALWGRREPGSTEPPRIATTEKSPAAPTPPSPAPPKPPPGPTDAGAGAQTPTTPAASAPQTTGAGSAVADDRAAAAGASGHAPAGPKPAPATTTSPAGPDNRGSVPTSGATSTPVTTPATRPATGAAAGTSPPVPAPGPNAPPPAPSPPPGAGALADGEVYAVHVASYKKLSQAEKDIAVLRKYGYTARPIQTDLGDKGVWFRVYVGSYATLAEANKAREALLALPEYDFAQVRRLPRE